MEKGEISNKSNLEFWKEIAAYLDRSEKTCRRWENELGLPIHRIEKSPKARVFAYKDELDQWVKEKYKKLDNFDKQILSLSPNRKSHQDLIQEIVSNHGTRSLKGLEKMEEVLFIKLRT